jgi:hypothetical protein
MPNRNKSDQEQSRDILVFRNFFLVKLISQEHGVSKTGWPSMPPAALR